MQMPELLARLSAQIGTLTQTVDFFARQMDKRENETLNHGKALERIEANQQNAIENLKVHTVEDDRRFEEMIRLQAAQHESNTKLIAAINVKVDDITIKWAAIRNKFVGGIIVATFFGSILGSAMPFVWKWVFRNVLGGV